MLVSVPELQPGPVRVVAAGQEDQDMVEPLGTRRRLARRLAALLLTAASAGLAIAGTDPVPFPQRDEEPLATARSSDGSRAVAYRSENKVHRTDLYLATPSSRQAELLEVPGVVRSLLFSRGGTLFAVVAKIGRRLPSVTYVLEVDPETLKGRRAITLPLSASGMAAWDRGRSVLVACEDELRSYSLPDFRSGPLYRILGSNSSLANVPGTDRFVIGRRDGVALVDLSDPHGVDEIPVRKRVETSAPVARVRVEPEDDVAVAVLDDGSIVRVPLDFGAPPARPETPDPALASQRTSDGEGLTAAPGAPEPGARTPARKRPEEPPPEDSAESPPAPSEATSPAPGAGREPPDDPTPPRPPAPPQEGGTAWGSLTGPARDRIVWVVLYGPDNVLQEALRVRPASDGTWTAAALAEGKYRIVLEAGPDRVVVSRPAFLVLAVRKGEVTLAEPFEVGAVR